MAFCTKCGVQLDEGAVFCQACGAKKEENGTQQLQQTPPKSSFFAEQMHLMFAELIPVLKKPVTTAKKLASDGKSMVGFGYVAIKTIVVLLFAIITLIRFNYAVGGYVSINAVSVILAMLLITAGADCLEGFLLKVFTDKFKEKTNYNSMMTVVGVRAIFEAVIYLVFFIVSLILPLFAIILLSLLTLVLPYIQYSGYKEVIGDEDKDKMLYVFFIVKVCVTIAIMVVLFIFIRNAIGFIMSGMIGSLGGYGNLL